MADSADNERIEPIRLEIGELGSDLAGYLRQVRNGRSFLITAPDGDVAELRPPPGVKPARRVPGTLRGKIWIGDNFDSLPDDILDAMEGRGE